MKFSIEGLGFFLNFGLYPCHPYHLSTALAVVVFVLFSKVAHSNLNPNAKEFKPASYGVDMLAFSPDHIQSGCL